MLTRRDILQKGAALGSVVVPSQSSREAMLAAFQEREESSTQANISEPVGTVLQAAYTDERRVARPRRSGYSTNAVGTAIQYPRPRQRGMTACGR